MPYLKKKALQLISEAIEETFPIARKGYNLKNKVNLIDIGASKGIQSKWSRYKSSIIPVLFEPNPDEAKSLRRQLSGYEKYYVLERGLADKAGTQTLNVGHWYGCTSILQANMDFLKDYDMAESYRVKKTVQVECVRYDDLVAAGEAPIPDVIKIDVEGYESFALKGFGSLLNDVLGIETEAFFYPVYKGQPLLHDLIDQLEPFGLRLRRIEEMSAFNGDFVCMNAYFTKTKKEYSHLSVERQAKYDLMSEVFRTAR